jgi:hypothetical protein
VPWSSGASHAGDISCCVGVLSNVVFGWHVLSSNEGGCMWYVEGWKRGGLKIGWAFVSYVETKNVITESIWHITELTHSRTKYKNTKLKIHDANYWTNTLIYRMFSFTQKVANKVAKKQTTKSSILLNKRTKKHHASP